MHTDGGASESVPTVRTPGVRSPKSPGRTALSGSTTGVVWSPPSPAAADSVRPAGITVALFGPVGAHWLLSAAAGAAGATKVRAHTIAMTAIFLIIVTVSADTRPGSLKRDPVYGPGGRDLHCSREVADGSRRVAEAGEIVVIGRGFVAVVGVALLVAGCGSARAAGSRTMTLTLVRHGQSTGNASGLIDTTTPGPELTPKGWCEATVAATQLAPNHYDGIFASTMMRTQQTATPTSQALGEPIEMLPGLREIEAGQYEGTPEADAPKTYWAAPQRGLKGGRSARIPRSVNGYEFETRFNEAVQHIYDSGDQNPVAFTHSVAIMVWVLMNVRNPDLSLLTSKPLPNVGHVVLTGNPTDGWTLTDWDADPPPC